MNKKRNWKKFLGMILLIVVLLFTSSSQIMAVTAKNYSFTMGTSSTGGTVYGVGAGLANFLSESIPNLQIRAISTGGAVDNVGMMQRKEIEISINTAGTNTDAWNGDLLGMDAQKNLRGIVSLYPSVFHFMVTKESGIKSISFDELVGSRGAVGASASGSEIYTRNIVGAAGLDYKERKDFTPVYISARAAADQMKDGFIDWGAFPLGFPASIVIDLSLAGKFNILPMEGEYREKLLSGRPYYIPFTIPAGIYPGFDEPIETAACVITFVADESVDEEIVYQMTKTIWENLDSVYQIMSGLSWMNLDDPYAGIGIPLHPGAERYYKEVGVIK